MGELDRTLYIFHAESYSIQHVLFTRIFLRQTRTSERVEQRQGSMLSRLCCIEFTF